MTGTRYESSSPSPVMIKGGGIVGVATAYYLSLARKGGHSITIVEDSSIVVAGAFGKANGLIGNRSFKLENESLCRLYGSCTNS